MSTSSPLSSFAGTVLYASLMSPSGDWRVRISLGCRYPFRLGSGLTLEAPADWVMMAAQSVSQLQVRLGESRNEDLWDVDHWDRSNGGAAVDAGFHL